LDAELRDRLHGRRNGDGEGIPIGVVGAIEDVGVGGRASAVHRWVQCYSAAPGLQIADEIVNETSELPRDRAWSQRDQRDDVAVTQRKRADEIRFKQVALRSLVCLQRGRMRRYRNRFGLRSHLQLEIEARLFTECYDDASGGN